MAKTAAQYVAEATANTGANKPVAAPAVPTGSAIPAFSVSGQKPGTQTPLGWLTDILSRPLYGMEAAVKGAALGGAKQQADLIKGNPGQSAVDSIASSNPITLSGDFLRGMFSAAPGDHNTTAQNEEIITDAFGKNDPNYKNVQDNVNPVVKGITGFVGDVALDPLTYVPGPDIVSVGAKLAKLGLVTDKGLSSIAKVAKVTDKIGLTSKNASRRAKEAIDKAVSTPPVNPETAANVAEGTNAAEQAAQTGIDPAPIAVDPVQQARDSIAQARSDPKNADLKKMVISIAPSKIQEVIHAARTPRSMVPLAFKDWLPEASKAVEKLPKLSDAPKVFWQGKKVPMPTVLNAMDAGDETAHVALRNFHEDTYLQDFRAAQIAGRPVDALSKEIKVDQAAPGVAASQDLIDTAAQDAKDAEDFQNAVLNPEGIRTHPDGSTGTNADWIASEVAAAQKAEPGTTQNVATVHAWMLDQAAQSAAAVDAARSGSGTATTTMLNSLQTFKKMKADNEMQVRHVLGNDIVNNLSTFSNPDSFDKTMSKLKGILDGSIDVTTQKHMLPTQARLLERLGIDPATIPLGVKKLQSTAGEPGTLSATEELKKLMNVDDNDHILQLADGTKKGGLDHMVQFGLKDADKMPHVSKMLKAKRTHTNIGEGIGVIKREFNTYSQADIAMDLFTRSRQLVQKLRPNTYGLQLAKGTSQAFRQALRLRERVVDRLGIPITLGVGYQGGDRVLLSGSQALDIMSSINDTVLSTTVFNHATAAPYTNLLDAVYAAVHGGSRDDIIGALSQTKNAYGTKEFENHLIDPVTHIAENGKKYMLGTQIFTGEKLTNDLADLIQQATPALQKQVEENALAHEARGLAETKLMTNDNLQALEMLHDSGGFGVFMREINDISSRVAQQGKDIGAMDESILKSQAIVEGSIPPLDMETAKVGEQLVKKADDFTVQILNDSKLSAKQRMKELIKVSAMLEQRKADAAAEDAARAAGPAVDLGTGITRKNNSIFFNKFNPFRSRAYGAEDFHAALIADEAVFREVIAAGKNALAKISREATGRDKIIEAFRTIQRETISGDAETAAIAEELRPLIKQMFGGSAISDMGMIDNSFLRNNNGIDHINNVLENKGLGNYLFDIDAAEGVARESGGKLSIHDAMARQWTGHDVQDPIDYMNKMWVSMATVNMHSTLANTMHNLAEGYGAVSMVPKEGFVPLTDTTGKSVLRQYLPDGAYYHQIAADQFQVVDNLLRETLDLGGPIGKFVNEIYKPALDMFKTGMTIINPSHHIRNGGSDIMLTANAEGFTTKPIYKWAVEAMQTGNKYDGWDSIAALNGIHARPKPGRTLFKGTLLPDGVSPAELYAASRSRGMLPTYRLIENLDEPLAEGTGGLLQQVEARLAKTKLLRAGGAVGEAETHWTRIAHFAQILEKNKNNTAKFKSREELYDYAVARVRKWHPDGSDLTKNDKLFRLIIPFYSWQRKSIPLVIETFLTHPARAQVIPKASYNLAIAMGVNPDSLSDPFPNDQLFPSYLADGETGPQFKIGGQYYGINPGFATTSALDTYAGGNTVLQAILGQVAPMIKDPFELATMKDAGTGGTINDLSDYADSQIPLVAPVSRLSGTSVTGSIASILQGKGLDPQYQVKKGNKKLGSANITALVNYLTGAGLTPMSQPNQINYAEIEKRNAASG